MTGTGGDGRGESGAGTGTAPGDEVRLTMPATPDLLRVARLAAAGLAGQMGLSVDEIEDVRIAVDELCFALVRGHGHDGTLTLTFRLGDDRLTIEGAGDFDPAAAAPAADLAAGPDLSELSALILGAVVDEHEITHDGVNPRFRLVKRRA
jgi:serine/threonine-protein kinase RsbW